MAQKQKKKLQVDKNIYQRGEYSFQVKMMIAGHKIDKTFDTLAEAQTYRDIERGGAALDHTEGAIYAARVKKRESKSYTFAEALKDYRAKSKLKKGYEQESASLDLLSRLPIADKPLYMIHKPDLLGMFVDIRSGKYRKVRGNIKKTAKIKPASEATARRYANLARHIFEVAVKDWGKLDRNPFEELGKDDKPKDGKPRDRRFVGDEYEKLKKVLDGEAQVALIVFVESAMRRSELLGLEWLNIRFNGGLGSARLVDTKNGEERTVPLSSVAVTALKTLPRGVKGKVFKLTPAMLTHQWRAARITIGSPDLRVHDLRHEATSRLFEDKNFNVIEASAVTGHKTLSMLKRYANLNPDLLAKKLG
jgi:integrase